MAGYIATSKSIDWSTPQKLFDELNQEFWFTLDACASVDNAKCQRYYTIKDNGLAQAWEGERVYCNPPYGKQIADWVRKASESNTLVVMLLPARTDTKWFHEYIYKKTEIRFIKGRLHFNDGKDSAPFPSMIVIFRPK